MLTWHTFFRFFFHLINARKTHTRDVIAPQEFSTHRCIVQFCLIVKRWRFLRCTRLKKVGTGDKTLELQTDSNSPGKSIARISNQEERNIYSSFRRKIPDWERKRARERAKKRTRVIPPHVSCSMHDGPPSWCRELVLQYLPSRRSPLWNHLRSPRQTPYTGNEEDEDVESAALARV